MRMRWEALYTLLLVAGITAIAGPQDWQVWAIMAFVLPPTDALGSKLAEWTGAKRAGRVLGDRIARWLAGMKS